MPFIVKKSFLRENPGFEVAVAAHAKELRDWLDREVRVAADAANPNIPEIERWAPCPKPEAPNGMVDSAVNELGNVDFVVEDDDPTPEQLLEVKKITLVRQLQAAEARARSSVVPVNKRPLREIRSADIAAADFARREEVVRAAEEKFKADMEAYSATVSEIMNKDPGLLAKAGFRMGITDDPRMAEIAKLTAPVLEKTNVDAEVEKLRPADETEFLLESERFAATDETISRNVAQALHDIEDLTVETVDEYRIPDLTKKG